MSASGCQLKEALPYQADIKENTNGEKQIGGTMYVVRVHFNEDAEESMKDKIKRLIENDVRANQHTA